MDCILFESLSHLPPLSEILSQTARALFAADRLSSELRHLHNPHLIGLRMKRIEALLKHAHRSHIQFSRLLRLLISHVQQRSQTPDTRKARWDQLPDEWYARCTHELSLCLDFASQRVQELDTNWEMPDEQTYVMCIQRLVTCVKRLSVAWDDVLSAVGGWRTIVESVANGVGDEICALPS